MEEPHLEVLQAGDVGPVPPGQTSHPLNDDVDVDLLLTVLLALLVDEVKREVPLGGLFVPDGRDELVAEAEEALELVLGGDAPQVCEDLGTMRVEVVPPRLEARVIRARSGGLFSLRDGKGRRAEAHVRLEGQGVAVRRDLREVEAKVSVRVAPVAGGLGEVSAWAHFAASGAGGHGSP